LVEVDPQVVELASTGALDDNRATVAYDVIDPFVTVILFHNISFVITSLSKGST
jgi:hypothetical protein